MKIKMIALRQTHYGVNRRRGEVFDVEPEHVRILTATKAAKPVDDEKSDDSKRYKRRDMRAEN